MLCRAAGPSLSRVGDHRTVVSEAVALARMLSAEDAEKPNVGDFLGRLSGHLPRTRLRKASPSPDRESVRLKPRRRSRSRASRTPATPAVDPLQTLFYKKALEQFETKGSKAHHFDQHLNKIHFDVQAMRSWLVGGDHSCIDPVSFPDHDMISRLKRDFGSFKEISPGVPFLHHARVECFWPRWFGNRMTQSAREAFVKLRLKHESSTVAQLCNASLSFWLAHMALGTVSFQQVACHVFPLLRLSEDYKPYYTIRYHDRLMTRLHNRISAGEIFDLGAAITNIDMDVLREVDHQASAASTPDPAERLPRVREEKVPRKGPRGRDSDPPAPDPSGKEERPSRRQQICFDHDPSSKKRCKLGWKSCTREHLNTLDPEELARYKKAKARFDANVKQSAKAAVSS